MHYFGTQDEFNVMVLDMLGPDLESLFCFCGPNEKVYRRNGDNDEEEGGIEGEGGGDNGQGDDEEDEEEEKKEFSMKTICMLGIEIMTRIEYVHSKGFLHRDIKP
jgi:serine/threonine protein kinase